MSELITELFATSVLNINIHIHNLLKEKELSSEVVIKESLIAADDGKQYRASGALQSDPYYLETQAAIEKKVSKSSKGKPL